MKKDSVLGKFLKYLCHYTVFFLLIGFVITCCMLLFVNTLISAMNVTLNQQILHTAAKLTFVNVLFLSLICTLADAVRREIALRRPARRIAQAAEKIMRGDFNVRLKPVNSLLYGDDSINQIIEYFNKMAQELSGMETLRADFIANVSHELKTPLAVMQNYAVMLSSPDLDTAKRAEYATAIKNSTKRLADLISNILKLNKLENQQIFAKNEKYNLSEQLCACLLDFEGAWEEKELEIETDIEDGVFAEADSELLTIVWNNLFSNAVKFTGKGGKISLSLKTEGAFAVVKVSDTGCGISADVGAHIFEKFYQGDTSRSSLGNGLGLALVKRVIDITGSEIFVESRLGEGSTFTVKIRRLHHGEA